MFHARSLKSIQMRPAHPAFLQQAHWKDKKRSPRIFAATESGHSPDSMDSAEGTPRHQIRICFQWDCGLLTSIQKFPT